MAQESNNLKHGNNIVSGSSQLMLHRLRSGIRSDTNFRVACIVNNSFNLEKNFTPETLYPTTKTVC